MHQWNGYWIDGELYHQINQRVSPAPILRKTFQLSRPCRKGEIFLCGLGWHELYVNGQKADDRVLAPVPTQYHVQASYICYRVEHLLREGKNAIAVLLGNGFYNPFSNDVWGFRNAAWRDFPKLLCDVVCDGEGVASSDETWKVHSSPIVFDGVRTGEIYDARLEVPDFSLPDLDDSTWQNAEQCTPPGGLLTEETMPPCRVTDWILPAGFTILSDGSRVYDFGKNLTGWCEISVQGKAGDSIDLRYAERIDATGDIEITNINALNRDERTQRDTYILKGEGIETYAPRFTYHGFRYVKTQGTQPLKIQACFVHTDFENAGQFTTSSTMLNKLQDVTRQSVLCNFTGYPTDCPHREKNGWTGDAQLAAETTLWNFHAAEAMAAFLHTVVATQRENGQLPGYAPNPGGSCYRWGNGPAWDAILFEYPYQIYLFTGNTVPIVEHYDRMKLYLEYCRSMETEGLVKFGLGDWCHPTEIEMVPTAVTSSAYYYYMLCLMQKFARITGHYKDVKCYQARAEELRKCFQQAFRKADGTYSDGGLTALAVSVFFGLADKGEIPFLVKKLAEVLRQGDHRAWFGIIGAKTVPRVLASHGYCEDAFKLITQEEYPGWGNWIKLGATTLWEHWDGIASLNHQMYGDISAWMYRYITGISPMEEAPGFRKFRLSPNVIPQLDFAEAHYLSPYGEIFSQWKREGNAVHFYFSVPPKTQGILQMPNGQEHILPPGTHDFLA